MIKEEALKEYEYEYNKLKEKLKGVKSNNPKTYVVLIPKFKIEDWKNKLNTVSLKNIFQLLKHNIESYTDLNIGLTLEDFDVYQVVYLPKYLKEELKGSFIDYNKYNDLFLKSIIKGLTKVNQELNLKIDIEEFKKYINPIKPLSNEYKSKVKHILDNQELLSVKYERKPELSHYKLFKIKQLKVKDLNNYNFIIYGLDNILDIVKEFTVKLETTFVKAYLKQKGVPLELVNNSYKYWEAIPTLAKATNFSYLYEMSNGNIIDPYLIKVLLPFIFDSTYKNPPSYNKDILGNYKASSFTKNINNEQYIISRDKVMQGYRITHTSSYSIIAPPVTNKQYIDVKNLFKYNLKENPRDLAEDVVRFINCYGVSENMHEYYKYRELLLDKYNELISEINNKSDKCKSTVNYIINITKNFILKINNVFGFVTCSPTMSKISFSSAIDLYKSPSIKLEPNKEIFKLELESFQGGMMVSFVQGMVEKPLITLDINSTYLNAMSKLNLPTSVKEYVSYNDGTTLKKLLYKAKHTQCCVARVKLSIPNTIKISPVPYKVPLQRKLLENASNKYRKIESKWDSISLYPIGNFNTVLCYHTLEYLYQLQQEGHNIICTIEEYVIYNSANYLKNYSNYLFKQRTKIKQLTKSQNLSDSAKQSAVTMYGKFASRKYNIEGKRLNIPNNNSFPAVSAHISDYSRIQIYKMMKIAGFENVYYVNTDGFKVNYKGLLNLEKTDLIDYKRKPIGKLKLESVGLFTFNGKAGYEGYYLGSNFSIPMKRRNAGFQNISTSNVELFDYFDSLAVPFNKTVNDTHTPFYKITDTNKLKEEYNKLFISNDLSIESSIRMMEIQTFDEPKVDKPLTLKYEVSSNDLDKESVIVFNHLNNQTNQYAEGLESNVECIRNLLNNNQIEEELDINI